jgi:hypothetical protein
LKRKRSSAPRATRGKDGSRTPAGTLALKDKGLVENLDKGLVEGSDEGGKILSPQWHDGRVSGLKGPDGSLSCGQIKRMPDIYRASEALEFRVAEQGGRLKVQRKWKGAKSGQGVNGARSVGKDSGRKQSPVVEKEQAAEKNGGGRYLKDVGKDVQGLENETERERNKLTFGVREEKGKTAKKAGGNRHQKHAGSEREGLRLGDQKGAIERKVGDAAVQSAKESSSTATGQSERSKGEEAQEAMNQPEGTSLPVHIETLDGAEKVEAASIGGFGRFEKRRAERGEGGIAEDGTLEEARKGSGELEYGKESTSVRWGKKRKRIVSSDSLASSDGSAKRPKGRAVTAQRGDVPEEGKRALNLRFEKASRGDEAAAKEGGGMVLGGGIMGDRKEGTLKEQGGNLAVGSGMLSEKNGAGLREGGDISKLGSEMVGKALGAAVKEVWGTPQGVEGGLGTKNDGGIEVSETGQCGTVEQLGVGSEQQAVREEEGTRGASKFPLEGVEGRKADGENRDGLEENGVKRDGMNGDAEERPNEHSAGSNGDRAPSSVRAALPNEPAVKPDPGGNCDASQGTVAVQNGEPAELGTSPPGQTHNESAKPSHITGFREQKDQKVEGSPQLNLDDVDWEEAFRSLEPLSPPLPRTRFTPSETPLELSLSETVRSSEPALKLQGVGGLWLGSPVGLSCLETPTKGSESPTKCSETPTKRSESVTEKESSESPTEEECLEPPPETAPCLLAKEEKGAAVSELPRLVEDLLQSVSARTAGTLGTAGTLRTASPLRTAGTLRTAGPLRTSGTLQTAGTLRTAGAPTGLSWNLQTPPDAPLRPAEAFPRDDKLHMAAPSQTPPNGRSTSPENPQTPLDTPSQSCDNPEPQNPQTTSLTHAQLTPPRSPVTSQLTPPQTSSPTHAQVVQQTPPGSPDVSQLTPPRNPQTSTCPVDPAFGPTPEHKRKRRWRSLSPAVKKRLVSMASPLSEDDSAAPGGLGCPPPGRESPFFARKRRPESQSALGSESVSGGSERDSVSSGGTTQGPRFSEISLPGGAGGVGMQPPEKKRLKFSLWLDEGTPTKTGLSEGDSGPSDPGNGLSKNAAASFEVASRKKTVEGGSFVGLSDFLGQKMRSENKVVRRSDSIVEAPQVREARLDEGADVRRNGSQLPARRSAEIQSGPDWSRIGQQRQREESWKKDSQGLSVDSCRIPPRGVESFWTDGKRVKFSDKTGAQGAKPGVIHQLEASGQVPGESAREGGVEKMRPNLSKTQERLGAARKKPEGDTSMDRKGEVSSALFTSSF